MGLGRKGVGGGGEWGGRETGMAVGVRGVCVVLPTAGLCSALSLAVPAAVWAPGSDMVDEGLFGERLPERCFESRLPLAL